MTFDEFQCVVVGSEPAGLWLLPGLKKVFDEFEGGSRLAHVPLSTETPRCAVPAIVAKHFNLNVSAEWSPELICPGKTFRWDSRALNGLPPVAHEASIDTLLNPGKADLQSIQRALVQDPKWLGYASGLHQFLGRSQSLSAEMLVHFSRYYSQLHWWEPLQELTGVGVESFPQISAHSSLEGFQAKKGGLAIRFEGVGEIVSRRWVFNLSFRGLQDLCRKCPEFLRILNVPSISVFLGALYPLRLRVQNTAVPCPVAPLNLIFDTDVVPEMGTEIWPFTLTRNPSESEITLWVSGPGLTNLETVLEGFRAGMGRLNKLFPFLGSSVLETSSPLDMSTCFGEAERAGVLADLERRSFEVYRKTAFHTATRSPFVSILMPDFGCHLPHPVGGLQAARLLIAAWTPKKKKTSVPAERGLSSPPF